MNFYIEPDNMIFQTNFGGSSNTDWNLNGILVYFQNSMILVLNII